MTNHIFKWITIIIVIIIFLYGFSVSYSSSNIDNISYVIGIGVDLTENKKNLKVSFEFTNVSPSPQANSPEKPDPIVETVETTSIENAINMMDVYLAKKINLAHCKVIVFSKEIAKQGIFNHVANFLNIPQVRPTCNLIISDNAPDKYLQASTSSLDKVLTKYYDIFPNSSEYTGYTSNITIGDFYNSLLYEAKGNVAILGGDNTDTVEETDIKNIKSGNSPIIGERGTENIGIAVFNKDKYVGDLSAIESLYHSILVTEVNNFILSLTYPDKNDQIDISLNQNNPVKISVSTDTDIPIIDIDISLSGKILSILKNIDYSDQNVLNNISNLVNENLKKNILDYLNKTKNTFKCDIDNFYGYAKKNFLTIDEWEDFNWSEKYLNSKFNINIETSIVSSLLVSGN